MLFALLDYLKFRSQEGRYSRNNSTEPMSYGFEGRLPEKIIRELKPADSILFASFNSWIAWLIMYLTSSQVSHVAMYIGDRRIVHATLSGVAIEPIESLFERKARMLVTRLRIHSGAADSFDESMVRDLIDRPYGYFTAVKKGLRILFGRDWLMFRWKFFADLVLLLVLLDVPFWLTLGSPIISTAAFALLAVVLANAVIWRIYPLPRFLADTGYPKDMLEIVVRMRGLVIIDADRSDE